MTKLPANYRKWISELKESIQQSQARTLLRVNADMLILYWYIGKQLEEKIEKEGWGAKIIDKISADLQKSFPQIRGFSVRNLLYMKQLSAMWPDMLVFKREITQQAAAQLQKKEKSLITQQAAAQLQKKDKSQITQQAAAQLQKKDKSQFTQQAAAQIGNNVYTILNPELISIPWGHHMYLLDKGLKKDEVLWYIQKVIENNWSRAILQYQVDTDLYTRQHKIKKATNFHLTLSKAQSELANQIIKDPYVFGFVALAEQKKEYDLEQQLIYHIREFLIELGAGFAFVGRQVPIKVGRKEYRLDLLFYHLHLRCFIVIELKMEDFEFEHAGKMNGYLNIVNKQLAQAQDNPSIGIILCASKDDVEVDFALTNIDQPIGVSEYKFLKMLPQRLRARMPTAKQLQSEVQKFLKQQSARKISKPTK
jgi:predicted nuclease of restriction endonuclease-like (RecB) superfamily